MSEPDPDNRPELGEYKSTIEIRETPASNSESHYKVVWRGVSGTGETVSDALMVLADNIESLE